MPDVKLTDDDLAHIKNVWGDDPSDPTVREAALKAKRKNAETVYRPGQMTWFDEGDLARIQANGDDPNDPEVLKRYALMKRKAEVR